MNEARKRLLFLCALHSIRSLMAASILTQEAQRSWDIWITPVVSNAQDMDLARKVLDEVNVALLPSPQMTAPLFHLSWDEGIVLCSGATDQ